MTTSLQIVTQFLDPGWMSFTCHLLSFSFIIIVLCTLCHHVCVLSKEKKLPRSNWKVQRAPLLTCAAPAAEPHFQFSHFCSRKKMLKSNNQGERQPAPAAWSCCAEWQWRSQRKKKEKDRKKKGGNFLLELDLLQLARGGGFLNACKTCLLF